MRKGRLNEAAQCCRQALSLNPLMVLLFSLYPLFIDIVAKLAVHLWKVLNIFVCISFHIYVDWLGFFLMCWFLDVYEMLSM